MRGAAIFGIIGALSLPFTIWTMPARRMGKPTFDLPLRPATAGCTGLCAGHDRQRPAVSARAGVRVE